MWDMHASFLPGVYLDGVSLAGGIAALLPPQPVDDEIAAGTRSARRADRHRRLRRRPGGLRSPTPSGHRRTGARPRRLGVRPAGARRCAAGCRCWASAVGPRCSTSRSAARCTSICPTSSATLGHRLGDDGVRNLHDHHRRRQQARRLIGESTSAQCYHHQAIDRLGADLIVSAVDSEGVIEGIEMRRRRIRAGRAVASRGDPRRSAAVRRVGRGRPVLFNRRKRASGNNAGDQPGHRTGGAHRRTARRRGRRRRRRPREVGPEGLGGKAARRACRQRSAIIRRGRRRPRRRAGGTGGGQRRATRYPPPNGKPATSATCCSSTPPPRNG